MARTQSSMTQFGRRLKAAIARRLAAIDSVLNPYRPELHYMRGPGPKWRARHLHVTVAHKVVNLPGA
jgi:hypothetical protein